MKYDTISVTKVSNGYLVGSEDKEGISKDLRVANNKADLIEVIKLFLDSDDYVSLQALEELQAANDKETAEKTAASFANLMAGVKNSIGALRKLKETETTDKTMSGAASSVQEENKTTNKEKLQEKKDS